MEERKVKLELKDMAKKYDNGDGVEHINLKVYEGEIVTLLGPSGCGKSTILRTIGGFMDVTDAGVKRVRNLPEDPAADQRTDPVFKRQDFRQR